MILVAGGTGRLGKELVPRLVAGGHQVRVLSRDPAALIDPAGELVVGDVRRAETLVAAVDGCSTVISAVHGFLGGRGGGPNAVDRDGNANLVRAAVGAKVDRFVLVSVLDAGRQHPISLHRAKSAAEQHLRASGLRWTVVRAAPFLETWLDIIGQKVPSGGPALVFGRAANPINFVSVRDVANVIERAIGDAAAEAQVFDVVGPENLTMLDIAHLLGAEDVKHVPRAALRVLAVAARPIAPALARQAAAGIVMDTTDMAAPSGPGPEPRHPTP